MNKVNVVNIGERYKRVTFTTYPHENKGRVNVVNIGRKYFGARAHELPNGHGFNQPIARSPNHSIPFNFPVNSLFWSIRTGKTRNLCGFYPL
jgi:hypothetical protein